MKYIILNYNENYSFSLVLVSSDAPRLTCMAIGDFFIQNITPIYLCKMDEVLN